MRAKAAGDLDGIFATSWRLLRANPIILLPGSIVGVVTTLLEWGLQPSLQSSSLEHFVARLATYVIATVADILTIAYTTGMAVAAWQEGRARLSDGWHALNREGVPLTLIALMLAGAAAGILAPFTFALSLILFGFLGLYAIPAAILGKRRGFGALDDSLQLAYDEVLPTLSIVLGLFALALAMGLVANLLSVAFLAGPLVYSLVVRAGFSFAALLAVGEYLAHRSPAENETPGVAGVSS